MLGGGQFLAHERLACAVQVPATQQQHGIGALPHRGEELRQAAHPRRRLVWLNLNIYYPTYHMASLSHECFWDFFIVAAGFSLRKLNAHGLRIGHPQA